MLSKLRQWTRPALQKANLAIDSPLTIAICIMCVSMYNIIWLAGGKPLDFALGTWRLSTQRALYTLVRLFTHSFTHVDWDHLHGNLMLLCFIAPPCERHYGFTIVWRFICCASIAASFIHYTASRGYLCGLSVVVFVLIFLNACIGVRSSNISRNMSMTAVITVSLYITKEILPLFLERSCDASSAHSFTHIDWDHLLGQLILLCLVAPRCERHCDSYTVFRVSCCASVAASLTYITIGSVYLSGLSVAVSALILLNAYIAATTKSIPLTAVITVWLWVTKEILPLFHERSRDASHVSHTLGAIVGATCAHEIAEDVLNACGHFLASLLATAKTTPAAQTPISVLPMRPGEKDSEKEAALKIAAAAAAGVAAPQEMGDNLKKACLVCVNDLQGSAAEAGSEGKDNCSATGKRQQEATLGEPLTKKRKEGCL